ncbi:hypothetical protein N7492_007557 [Penicillium capsulatum]|uniref:Uncharacterized protein n=1 Tax=Penicillium capsulatum TaxID=69766 RepID=A0A9W9I473_9EURO|nr:hypothetical protein N7492_007557 [Penicillium capsulatum]KAJ6117391.1 hypothetical protein N7512_007116 [Penicillium capsulatum]
MATKLSILVFVASPLDYARYRHTALFFQFDHDAQSQIEHVGNDGSTEGNIRSSVMEVVGSTGFFSFGERVNWKVPASSTNLARIIPVADIPSTTPISALRSTVASTPIEESQSGDSDWNSQNWIGDALSRLVATGYLDRQARDRSLDAMVDAVLEAGDEKVS